MWTDVVVLAGVIIALAGTVAILLPGRMMQFLDFFHLPSKIWPVAALRLGFGVLLWLVADGSAHPTFLHGLAVVVVAAAIALPILGPNRVQNILNWWLTRPPLFIRGAGVLVFAFGLYLVQALRGG